MSPAELAAHGRRKIHQFSDRLNSNRRFASIPELPLGSTFPILPAREAAPASLRATLQRDVADILKGRWLAFGYLPLQIDDPPRWHKDYLAGIDMATDKPALKLHHRLEGQADIKLIWEPNRWYSLVRLAQGAYVLNDTLAAETCLRWLEHWTANNPPYFGWNWTSALETGLRLIQFAWIDALLSGAFENPAPGSEATPKNCLARLAQLRARILPPHLWFTWRDRSFGSSANNHLIGELAGLIVALVRWPASIRWASPVPKLQQLWEQEVLKQFAPDGGNREQALNYHLFSFEFCWLARLALVAAGRSIHPEVEDRLRAAAAYFCAVQVEAHQFDYGDSDSAFVTPLFAEWHEAAAEWHRWFRDPAASPALQYWIDNPPEKVEPSKIVARDDGWRVFPESGYAVCSMGAWFLRWDLSSLGYLATASHGHCDALHISIWFNGEPVVIDPGTGTYHYDRRLRDYLSSWEAHNGPHPVGLTFPERRGAFLWAAHHEKPRWEFGDDRRMTGVLAVPGGTARRTIVPLPSGDGWQIEDSFHAARQDVASRGADSVVQVFWQLPPSANLRMIKRTVFHMESGKASVRVELDDQWSSIDHGSPGPDDATSARQDTLRGNCSPAFRKVQTGPWLLLRGPGDAGRVLRTVFRAHL